MSALVDSMRYTVILIAPDYLASPHEDGIYVAHVSASSPQFALDQAREEAWHAYCGDTGEEPDYTDFACVALYRGHLEDLSGGVR